MSWMSMPYESLSISDLSWLKLCRHATECEKCRGTRTVRSLADAFSIATTGIDYCDEWKRLVAVHAANTDADRRRT